MISRTAEYALRAMAVLCRHGAEGPVLASVISVESGVPAAYVATIMHRLGHAGLVTGRRGRGGGFTLRPPAEAVTVRDIVAVFDDIDAQTRCVLGHKVCGSTTGCPVHHQWSELLDAYERFLDGMTLDQLGNIQRIDGFKRGDSKKRATKTRTKRRATRK